MGSRLKETGWLLVSMSCCCFGLRTYTQLFYSHLHKLTEQRYVIISIERVYYTHILLCMDPMDFTLALLTVSTSILPGWYLRLRVSMNGTCSESGHLKTLVSLWLVKTFLWCGQTQHKVYFNLALFMYISKFFHYTVQTVQMLPKAG